MKKLLEEKGYLDSILNDGIKKANEIALDNIKEIKKIISFYRI